jgi:hypothetical protein
MAMKWKIKNVGMECGEAKGGSGKRSVAERRMNAKIIGGIAGATLFLLFVTKPSKVDFDQQVTDILRSTIGNTSLSNKREIFVNMKRALSISNTDYFVAAHYEATGSGTDIACWGLLTKLACSGGVALPVADSEAPVPSGRTDEAR